MSKTKNPVSDSVANLHCYKQRATRGRHPFQWLPGNIDLPGGMDAAVLNGWYNTLSSLRSRTP